VNDGIWAGGFDGAARQWYKQGTGNALKIGSGHFVYPLFFHIIAHSFNFPSQSRTSMGFLGLENPTKIPSRFFEGFSQRFAIHHHIAQYRRASRFDKFPHVQAIHSMMVHDSPDDINNYFA
jgi:hypothetical protein